MNIASSHQRQKTEVLKLEDRLRSAQHDCLEAKKHGKSLDQELTHKEDVLSRSQTELKVAREELVAKVGEIERLEGVIRDTKVELSASQRDHRQAQNMVSKTDVVHLFV